METFRTGCEVYLNRVYDGFNRLTSRNVYIGGAQNYTYTNDLYGNRWNETPLNGGFTSSLSFSTTTNKIISTGFVYDAAGNPDLTP